VNRIVWNFLVSLNIEKSLVWWAMLMRTQQTRIQSIFYLMCIGLFSCLSRACILFLVDRSISNRTCRVNFLYVRLLDKTQKRSSNKMCLSDDIETCCKFLTGYRRDTSLYCMQSFSVRLSSSSIDRQNCMNMKYSSCLPVSIDDVQ
jgi:hypothetical protein